MKITIIGCGWLGLPLAEKLIVNGHSVLGSTTNPDKLAELDSNGIGAFIYDGNLHQQIPEECSECNLLILNFPPSRSQDYPKQVNAILSCFNDDTRVIFTSSTGVYEDYEGTVTEESPIKEDHPVALAEQAIRESGKPFCIIRLAGLIGGERHPVKYLSGRIVSEGSIAVNLIHRDDVISGILKIMNGDHWNVMYNLVHPEHPSKADYYSEVARKMGLPEPIFDNSVKKGKCVSGKKFEDELGFIYDHHI